MKSPALLIDSLSFSVNGNPILKDVSLSIDAGQNWSIIGANGAGKSTLLKCLIRIHGDWTGKISLFNRSIRDYSQRALARRMAYVPQPGGDQRFPFTVRQFTALGRYAYSGMFGTARGEDKAVVEGVMERAGVEAFADRTLDTLSGGERQRVFIAAALAQQGDILLLDEPTAFLDYRQRAEVSRILRGLNHDDGVTVVTVTHDVNTAILAGGNVLALREGEVAWTGRAGELTRDGRLQDIFATPFRFIDDPVSGMRLVAPQEAPQ